MEEVYEIKHEPIERLIKNGYKLRIGHYIETAFKIYRKYFWGFVGVTAIMLVIILGISFSIGLPFGQSIVAGKETHSGIFVIYLVVTPVISFLSFLLMSGYFIVARKIYFNQTFSFDNFFDGTKHWKQLLFASLITCLILLVFLTQPIMDLRALFLTNRFPDNIAYKYLSTPLLFKNTLVAVIFLIIGIYFTIAFKWIQQFIIFSGMNYYKAIMTSLKVITKRWFMFALFDVILNAIIILPLLLFFLIMILTLVSSSPGHFFPGIVYMLILIIPCLLWMFLAMPVLYISLYTAFEDIVGTNSKEQGTVNN